MIDARFVPIDQWPGGRTRPYARKNSPFRAPYLDTLNLLEYELSLLKAKDVLFQSGFTRAQLRNDGWPRAGENPSDPGIIISFQSPKGDLSFPCDTYNDFQANMRAIGLALEALRAVDRYGVTKHAEQYKGWQKLPEPGATSHFKNAEDAARFIAIQSRINILPASLLGHPEVLKETYRKAAFHLHPDRGGNVDQFNLLQEAMAILEAA